MKFTLLDAITEQSPDRIVGRKQVTLAEEYLADHFPGFPVLPGVFMAEAMVQAARVMLAPHHDGRLVLGGVQALKFGAMVRPGETLEVEVRLGKVLDGPAYVCRGTGVVRRLDDPGGGSNETAVSGRFTMRPIQTR